MNCLFLFDKARAEFGSLFVMFEDTKTNTNTWKWVPERQTFYENLIYSQNNVLGIVQHEKFLEICNLSKITLFCTTCVISTILELQLSILRLTKYCNLSISKESKLMGVTPFHFSSLLKTVYESLNISTLIWFSKQIWISSCRWEKFHNHASSNVEGRQGRHMSSNIEIILRGKLVCQKIPSWAQRAKNVEAACC